MAVAADKSPRDPVREELRELLLENWGGDTDDDVEACLHRAKRADSSTSREKMKRCPSCGAVRVTIKPGSGWRNIPNRKDSTYKCSTCHSHFNHPAPPIAEVRERLRDELPEAAGRAGRLAAVLGGVDR